MKLALLVVLYFLALWPGMGLSTALLCAGALGVSVLLLLLVGRILKPE